MKTGLFGNSEFKKAVRILLIFQAVLAIFLTALVNLEAKVLQQEIKGRYEAIAGKLIRNNPSFETDIVSALGNKESRDNISYGEKILARYGFNSFMDYHPFFQNLYAKRIVFIIIFITVSFAGGFIILYYGYDTFYKKVRVLAEASEQVVEGNYKKSVPSIEEGDFGILEHRFNQMCERLEQGMTELKSEKNFLRETISDISHQLKTPLSTLIINNELMLNDTDMNTETRNAFLKRNGEQLKRMEWLTQSLLKIARLEAGSIVFKVEKVPLAEIISEAVFSLEEMAVSRAIQVKIDKPGNPVIFKGDGEWFKEALINIIKNAYEHCRENGQVQVAIFETALFYGLSIKDNGVGISEKDLPNIFKRFYKSGSSVKQNSVGIGLALSKSIIEGQGGSISVKSEVGKGSDFVITFLKD